MHTEVVQVTPEMAAVWLATSRGNRPISDRALHAMVVDMKLGKWMLTGETIIFDLEGCLVDGHHRLRAVVASGCTVSMNVTVLGPLLVLNVRVPDFVDAVCVGANLEERSAALMLRNYLAVASGGSTNWLSTGSKIVQAARAHVEGRLLSRQIQPSRDPVATLRGEIAASWARGYRDRRGVKRAWAE